MFASGRLLLASTILMTIAPDAAAAAAGGNESSTAAVPPPTFRLWNNVTVPMIGLGSASGVRYPHVASAIEIGYRFVDTAQSHSWGYREEDVGRAVRDAGRRREDRAAGDDDVDVDGEYVFVQTKVHPEDLGYESTRGMIRVSLDRLQSTSLDSVLIHKPRCWEGACKRVPEGTWHDSWRALEEAMDSGIVRAIGMCDVDENLLDELLGKRIWPHVVQNWFDPYHQDKSFRRRIDGHNAEHTPPSGRSGTITGNIPTIRY